MRSTRVSAIGFACAAFVALGSAPAMAQSTVGPIAPATRYCQLTGDFDTSAASGWSACTSNPSTCVATGNLTETRVGLRGTDLGSSFADGTGRTWFLFGDTLPALAPIDSLSGWGMPPNGPGGTWTDASAGFTTPRVSNSDSWARR